MPVENVPGNDKTKGKESLFEKYIKCKIELAKLEERNNQKTRLGIIHDVNFVIGGALLSAALIDYTTDTKIDHWVLGGISVVLLVGAVAALWEYEETKR
jgi:hypothetical protein